MIFKFTVASDSVAPFAISFGGVDGSSTLRGCTDGRNGAFSSAGWNFRIIPGLTLSGIPFGALPSPKRTDELSEILRSFLYVRLDIL
jgi:hypothetical protein